MSLTFFTVSQTKMAKWQTSTIVPLSTAPGWILWFDNFSNERLRAFRGHPGPEKPSTKKFSKNQENILSQVSSSPLWTFSIGRICLKGQPSLKGLLPSVHSPKFFNPLRALCLEKSSSGGWPERSYSTRQTQAS